MNKEKTGPTDIELSTPITVRPLMKVMLVFQEEIRAGRGSYEVVGIPRAFLTISTMIQA
jgi:hypothetical protein